MPPHTFLSFFLALSLLHPPPRAVALTAPSDVAALAAFKAAVLPSSVSPWSCLRTWNFSAADPCASPRRAFFVCGLTCDDDDDAGGVSRVTAVVLDNGGYEGSLSPAVGKLSRLVHLDLSGNAFRGPLPPSLGSLPSLRTLSLAYNAFSGQVPLALSNLRALELLDLSHNALAGPVPAVLSGLVALTRLDLSYNRLSGGLPPSLPPNLISLALRGNAIAGPIPRSTFASLRRLEVVELAANQLTGRVEGWFLRMPALQQVDLANNTLVGLSLSVAAGSSPTSGSPLVALDLGYNRIEGELPAELAGFPALTSLTLRHNRLRGAIPLQYSAGKAGNPFRRLFLDGNFLNGKVPGAFLGGADVTGSFGDNCLEGCPAAEQLCRPLQKPAEVCRDAYGLVARGTRRGRPAHPVR